MNIRILALALALSVTPACTSLPQETERPFGQERAAGVVDTGDSLTMLIGFRQMTDDEDWGGLDDQVHGGLEYVNRFDRSIVGMSFGAIIAYADDSASVGGTALEVETYTGELYVGPKVQIPIFDFPIQVHVGAGASILFADAEFAAQVGPIVTESDDTDFALGGYSQAGIDWFLNPTQSIGISYRRLDGADVDLLGGETTLDYSSYNVTFTAVF